VLSAFQPFKCKFSSFGQFTNPPTALYLVPDPSDALVRMTEALVAAFPSHEPYGGAYSGVVPHLTLAESDDTRLWSEVQNFVASELPIRTEVHEFSIYRHEGARWVEAFRLPLGVTPTEPSVDQRLGH
jgi:2'-5' RNA ligase